MASTTTTLFKIIQSELIKAGKNEMTKDDPNSYFYPKLDFLWFEDELQFTTKVLKYDDDIAKIVNTLFADMKLSSDEYDRHFKKAFVNRFANRQINRQTVEAFKMELVSVFLTYEDYINRIYTDMEKYTVGASMNEQGTKTNREGSSNSDNRSAFADLPQSEVNLDVDKSTMSHASDNTISRNKQSNNETSDSNTTGNSKSYNLDTLVKSGGVLESVFQTIDRKCFLQVW